MVSLRRRVANQLIINLFLDNQTQNNLKERERYPCAIINVQIDRDKKVFPTFADFVILYCHINQTKVCKIR